MKTLEFYGHSDDVFVAGNDEVYTRAIVITSGDDSLVVTAHYLNNGCWSIGIAPYDEDKKMPNWPISYRQSDRGYSTVLSIDVPDNVIVEEYAA